MSKLLNERAANYDLLRCLCVWAVIINHVSDVTLFWEGSGQVISYIFVLFGPFLMKMKSVNFYCSKWRFAVCDKTGSSHGSRGGYISGRRREYGKLAERIDFLRRDGRSCLKREHIILYRRVQVGY